MEIINTGIEGIWGCLEFWNNSPRQIEKEEIKPLSSLDIMTLRYAAMELLAGNDETEYNIDNRDGIENAASICDNRLYVGDFEGYYLTEDYTLQYFYMHKDNRVCCATYNEQTDDFQYWLVY